MLLSYNFSTAESTVGKTIIVIDPGHGGVDPGAVGADDTLEKDITLEVAKLIYRKSFRYSSLNVVLTRRNDRYLHPYDRTGFANKRNAVAFVSIHADSFHDPSVEGTTTLVANESGSSSRNLAETIQAEIASKWISRDRGVRSASLFIREARMPAILVELGFLSNPNEAKKLRSSSYQEKFATAILDGLKKYIRVYGS